MATLLYIPRFDETGAAPRYRVYQYLPALRHAGFEIDIRPLLSKTYLHGIYFKRKRSLVHLFLVYLKRALFLFFNKNKYDLVLMDGELFPYVPYFIERLFLPRHRVMDQDDAIFHTYDQHKNSLVRWLLGNKINKIMAECNHVILCNDYAGKYALAHGIKHITILPTVVDAERYRPMHLPIKTKSIVIGWVGSPVTIHSLKLIEPVLQKLAREVDITLAIIGANYKLYGVKTICANWIDGWNEEEEIKLTNQIDIGIMPLYDTPYENGKGGFKLIKYMACAKPMIASPIGMNKEIVDHDINGFLARNLHEWEIYLHKLITDPNLRDRIGQAGREKMLRQYSLQATTPCFVAILQQACRKNIEQDESKSSTLHIQEVLESNINHEELNAESDSRTTP